ncbi:MAG TPA: hypothetical protein VHA73_03605 [Acidimicrobiales bacterium]|jgi:hypothetical protein|nr:hypothetical protein [Acidimicrobiales bacterium]
MAATTAPARRTATAVPRRATTTTRRPDLRVVDPRPWRIRRGVVVVAALVFVFGALLASAVFHALLAQGQQRLDHLNSQVSDAQQTYDRQRLEVDRLSAPDRIVSRAEQLGMVTPTTVETITPAPGTGAEIADVPGDNTPAPADANTGYATVKPYLGTDR